ncbi:hypothetical protein HanIR_Chr03g0148051 [Helianthus annuus]|nr:hypothetical protein HanIR_Chr03g0148051 [Helianthus annuus]
MVAGKCDSVTFLTFLDTVKMKTKGNRGYVNDGKKSVCLFGQNWKRRATIFILETN